MATPRPGTHGHRCNPRRRSVPGVLPEGERRIGSVGLLIYEAAKQGDLDNLKFALALPDAKENVNHSNRDGQTPLIIAAQRGHLECVKLLLCHSADMTCTTRMGGREVTAAQAAEIRKHHNIAKYLHGCIDDLMKYKTTRAHMEADIHCIASTPGCTSEDLKEYDFATLLGRMISSCGYTLNGDGEREIPLIMRAVEADNGIIVKKLVEEFGASLFVNDPVTGETALHVACRNTSALRFFIMHKCPMLAQFLDASGNLALHVACSKNDYRFVAWLFGCILEEEDSAVDVELFEGIPRCYSLPHIHAAQPYSRPYSGSVNPDPRSSIQPSQYHSPVSRRKRKEGSGGATFELQGNLDRNVPEELASIRGTQNGSFTSSGDATPVEFGKHLQDIVPSDYKDRTGSFLSSGEATLVGSDKHTRELVTSTQSARSWKLTSSGTSTIHSSSEMQLEDINILALPLDERKPRKRTESLYDHPLLLRDIIDLKPFRLTSKGESVLHLVAREGFSELLHLLLKVARFFEHNFQEHKVNLGVLTQRNSFTQCTPLEEAITHKHVDCVKLLIEFAEDTGSIGDIAHDNKLLKSAVLSKDIEIVKVLVQFGFYEGLEQAISLAYFCEAGDILRLLLYFHTQVQNALEFSRVRRNRTVVLDTGGVKWVGFQIDLIKTVWLDDTYNAVDCVSKAFQLTTVFDSAATNRKFFRELGKACLKYCSDFMTLQSISPTTVTAHTLVPIVEVNLSENQLTSVPPELFRMQSLRMLTLMHNALKELPSTANLCDPVYTAPFLKVINLDWNKLETLPEDLFSGLASTLEELTVNSNELQDLPPSIWVVPKLKTLRLGHNHLKRLHYFSSPRFFDNQEFSQKVVSWFTVSDGVLERKVSMEKEGERGIQLLEEYIRKAGTFCRTVHSALGTTSKHQFKNVLQVVIDVHWMRYNCYSNHQPQNEETYDEERKAEEVTEDEEDEDQEKNWFETNYSKLSVLDLSHNEFEEIPWDLACIAPNLQRLDLRRNRIKALDIVHSVPANISTLLLDQNEIQNIVSHREPSLPCGNPVLLLSLQAERTGIYCDHCKQRYLENLTNLTIDQNKLEVFPAVEIFEHSVPSEQGMSTFDNVSYQPYFPNLSILSLESNLLSTLPSNLHHLSHLSSLTLSRNQIKELPLEMGLMNMQALLVLKLDGVYIRNVPQTLLEKPTPKYLLSYLKSMLQNSRPYRRIKLMVVGEANKGKTSLLLNLTKRGRVTRFKQVTLGYNSLPLSTVGVDLGDWEYSPRGKDKVTFMTWDFGGQEEYYATHQCFLTSRSLFLLVWSIEDGEAGLQSLRPWLENIEGRAPKSPVIVVGTHLDSLPSSTRTEVISKLKKRFHELYVGRKSHSFSFPSVDPSFIVVNCYENRLIDGLRNYIYEYAMKYKLPGPAHIVRDMLPLLEQPIPETYIQLQDTVRALTQKCAERTKIPIYTRKEYISEIRASGFGGKIDELDQATSFLHDNGILLHFEDSMLSDLYFVDPQWLCSMLADVITVPARNPFQKNGFMMVESLKQIFRHRVSNFSLIAEFTTLMQKFEVILLLDEHRVLIPSLLPPGEVNSCVVFPKSVNLDESEAGSFEHMRKEPPAPIYQTPFTLFVRYYLVPFVPNGFFPRLIARVMGSEIIDHMSKSLSVSSMEQQYVLNTVHWKCWREGIVLIWKHMEIFRIAPLNRLSSGNLTARVVSKSGEHVVETTKGIEIKVAILPESEVSKFSVMRNPEGVEQIPQVSRCLATWLLQQATTIVDSVFDDWYEGFGRKKGFELSMVQITNPCPTCFQEVRLAQNLAATPPLVRRITQSISLAARTFSGLTSGPATSTTLDNTPLYLFSSPYCACSLAEGRKLECPTHGTLTLEGVAPDLVFCDFPPALLFMNPKAVVARQTLGEGGFGVVSQGTVDIGQKTETIAIKRFTPTFGLKDIDSECSAETVAWEIYQNASLEARMMSQMEHPHILGLIGVTFEPIRLLLELAPLGDLKHCIRKFQKAKVKLSRRTQKTTMTQVAEALDYLHSKKIVYRDLKPGNVLVWQFPLPTTQWNFSSSICVKLADYGICKQVSPQGLRGIQGTPPYLPPEVVLHGGQEAYSTKVDVYSFGMFMYYLFTFLNPFENDTRPITALLEEKRRPELAAKHRPASVQMFELMCWCWSDKPQHRPDFQEILNVLRTDTFTQLLSVMTVTRDDDEITAACIRTAHTTPRRRSSFGRTSLTLFADSFQHSFGSASLLSTASSSGEVSVEIWYGTEQGSISMANYQHSGTTIEPIGQPSKKYLSTMCVACGNIWVSTVGSGIYVYSPTTKAPIAVWGQQERHKVYMLLFVEESYNILALTQKGIFVFEANISWDNPSMASCDVLSPTHSFPPTSKGLNLGVVIPPGQGMDSSEIWVCSQTGSKFFILDPGNFAIKEEVPMLDSRDSGGHKFRHMEPLVIAGVNCLVVADRHIVNKWDVKSRRRRQQFDCHKASGSIAGDNTRDSRVTSLLAASDVLYIGTGRGTIIALDSATMDVISLLHAYDKATRCLLHVSSGREIKPFVRMFSRKEQSGGKSPRTSVGSMTSMGSSSSLRSVDDQDSSERYILLSFGKHYRGVVGSSPNHPYNFDLPVDTGAASRSPGLTGVDAQKPAKPLSSLGYLLVWSPDGDLQRPLSCLDELEEHST